MINLAGMWLVDSEWVGLVDCAVELGLFVLMFNDLNLNTLPAMLQENMFLTLWASKGPEQSVCMHVSTEKHWQPQSICTNRCTDKAITSLVGGPRWQVFFWCSSGSTVYINFHYWFFTKPPILYVSTYFNPTASRVAKTQGSFGHSECKRKLVPF